MTSLYFGVWDPRSLGHGYHVPGGRRPVGAVTTPWPHVDGKLAPTIGPRQKYFQNEAVQGVASLTHKGGWTALSFWDRTGDSRGNSSSTFLFDETLTFDDALARARVEFPSIFARFPFEVVPADSPPTMEQGDRS